MRLIPVYQGKLGVVVLVRRATIRYALRRDLAESSPSRLSFKIQSWEHPAASTLLSYSSCVLKVELVISMSQYVGKVSLIAMHVKEESILIHHRPAWPTPAPGTSSPFRPHRSPDLLDDSPLKSPSC